MARIRTIKPEFTESESIGKLSREARLLFILLWTFVDDEGRSRASSRLLASRLFPYDDDALSLIGSWLGELERGGHIRLYEIDGDSYLDIPKWLKHQKIDHPSKSRLPEFRDNSRILASHPDTLAPHTLDLGPVPRTLDLGPVGGADAPNTPSRKPRHGKSGTRLPDDWQASAALRDYAASRGLDVDETIDAFRDWWRAATGPNATKHDWDAAFRTWCRRSGSQNAASARQSRAIQPPRGNDAFYEQLAAIANRGGR